MSQQEQDPLFSERQLLEAQNPEQLVELVLQHAETIERYKATMDLAAEVLTGYGTSIEEELQKREQGNGTA